MDMPHSVARVRVSWYIHVYLWVGFVAIGTIPFLLISGGIYNADHALEGLSLFLGLVVLFQMAFWFARRRCSSDRLTGWGGLLLVTAHMCVGLSGLSALIAILAGAAAAVAMIAIALWSLVNGGHAGARERYLELVAWFHKHRMYQ